MTEQRNELGYYAVTRHPADAKVVFAEARTAEELGLGACHVGERFTVKDAAVLSGALAGCTTSLGIAPSTNHHTRHPTVTATIRSTMHALTDGRFAMAFGRGMGAYWQAIGLPVVTEARLRDFIGILRRLWDGETILNHDGPAGKWPVLCHANDLTGAPPIGMVAVGPKTMQLAGEICDFVVLHTFFSDEATAASVARCAAGPSGPARHLPAGLRRCSGSRQRLGPCGVGAHAGHRAVHQRGRCRAHRRQRIGGDAGAARRDDPRRMAGRGGHRVAHGYSGQLLFRMISTKSSRAKDLSKWASTSALTVPKVVRGRCFIPSVNARRMRFLKSGRGWASVTS